METFSASDGTVFTYPAKGPGDVTIAPPGGQPLTLPRKTLHEYFAHVQQQGGGGGGGGGGGRRRHKGAAEE